METQELTEQEFTLIKLLCANNVLLVTVPAITKETAEKDKIDILKNIEQLKKLMSHGFLENREEDFKEQNEELVKLGYNPIIAYSLTEMAYKMFNPPAGMVN